MSYMALIQLDIFTNKKVTNMVSTEISESPKFCETFRSVSVKRFAKFRMIPEVSEAEIFAKFRSVSTISVGSEIQIVSEIQVCDDSSKQSLKLLNLYDFFP